MSEKEMKLWKATFLAIVIASALIIAGAVFYSVTGPHIVINSVSLSPSVNTVVISATVSNTGTARQTCVIIVQATAPNNVSSAQNITTIILAPDHKVTTSFTFTFTSPPHVGIYFGTWVAKVTVTNENGVSIAKPVTKTLSVYPLPLAFP
jgi:hypothetical protein